ncbi:MAG: type II 3-dehydroquinate dehydratase [Alphaproteobacteria bacterium]|nr:type II 3-dehydroquinate dehydratase [Alphaproteobacteria bacterium]
MQPILLVNGPNLNMLGSREPEIYGSQTLADIEAACVKSASGLGLALECYQSNHEGELVTKIQQAAKVHKGVIINAGAYTHTSIAIMDALLSLSIPVIEVHMSNIFRREDFRHESYVSKASKGIICGFGADSYQLALLAMAKLVAA